MNDSMIELKVTQGQQVIAKYDAEIRRILENPDAITENTWRGLLAHFYNEIDRTLHGNS